MGMFDSTEDCTLTTARRLLIGLAVKELYQNTNADKKALLREELEALRAYFGESRQLAYAQAYVN